MIHPDPALMIAETDTIGDSVMPLRRRLSRAGAVLAARPVTMMTVATILLTVALLFVPLCSDVAWQLWIAHHIRMGARLYVDIVETNPPLWYWMAMPIDGVADTLGIAPHAVLIATLALVTIASLAATERLIRHIPAGRRTLLLVYMAAIVMIVPMWMTEQREQLLLIAALPYIALAAARREGRAVPLWLAIGIGVGAALGVALKHYFLIAPGLLELWVILELKRAWRAFRPETIGATTICLIYAAAILFLTPDFLTRIVPLLRLTYGSLGANSLWGVFQASQCVWIASILLLAFHHRLIGRATPFTFALLVATAGFAAAWAIQHKGWTYQGIATSGGLAIAIAALIAETGQLLNPATPIMLAAPILLGWHGDGDTDSYAKALTPLAAETRAGDTVGIIALAPQATWPFTSEHRLRFPNRYYGYWMLNAVVEHERGDHDPRLSAIGRDVVDATALDYRCTPPGRIVFFHTPHSADFDIYDFFQRRPAFRELMTHYRREQWVGQTDVFRQISPLAAVPRTDCRRGV